MRDVSLVRVIKELHPGDRSNKFRPIETNLSRLRPDMIFEKSYHL